MKNETWQEKLKENYDFLNALANDKGETFYEQLESFITSELQKQREEIIKRFENETTSYDISEFIEIVKSIK